jgi:hypothetical protein
MHGKTAILENIMIARRLGGGWHGLHYQIRAEKSEDRVKSFLHHRVVV